MSWTAVAPLKGGSARKSRLAPVLDQTARAELSHAMATHVLGRLRACAEVDKVLLLTPEPPSWPQVTWRRDEGAGLNAELMRLRADLPAVDILVLHADLPLLRTEDIAALLGAVHGGIEVAVAPDRHGLGTNALAIRRGRPFDFAFGSGSFARHLAQAPDAAVVERPGLQLDIDTPQDLDAARRAGLSLPALASLP